MSVAPPAKKPATPPSRRPRRGRRRSAPGLSLLAQGEPMVWLTGGALAICLVMIIGLLGLVIYFGTGTFWPVGVTQVQTVDGAVYQGEVTREDSFDLNYGNYAVLSGPTKQAAGDLLHPLFRQHLSQLLAGGLDAELEQFQPAARRTLLNALALSPKIQFAPDADRAAFLKQVEEKIDEQLQTQRDRFRDELKTALQDETGWKIDQLWDGYRTALQTLPAEGELPAIHQKFTDEPQLAYQMWADQMVTLLGADVSVPMRRRLIRTGNFELTGEHFHWVSDFEVNKEESPEWATVVERAEWGRFYGQPQHFSLRHPRRTPAAETVLRETVEFLQANQYRLQDDKERDEFNAALVPVSASYEQTRNRNVRSFLDSFEVNDGQKFVARINGQPVPMSELPAGQEVKELYAVWEGAEPAWAKFREFHNEVRDRFLERRKLEKFDIGEVNREITEARLELREQELANEDLFLVAPAREVTNLQYQLAALEESRTSAHRRLQQIEKEYGKDSVLAKYAQRFVNEIEIEVKQQAEQPQARIDKLQATFDSAPAAAQAALDHYFEVSHWATKADAGIKEQINALNDQIARYELQMVTAQKQEKSLNLGDIVRAYPANQLATGDQVALFFSRWGEFLWDDPREANSEGGVFPAIWGTVAMTLIMSLVVVPFGVMAALYLREYARGGLIVSAVRISINNLAGVPSIVFGVFGLGFFCYLVGAYVDGGPKRAGFTPLPPAGWWLRMAMVAIVCVAAFAASAYNLTGNARLRKRWVGYVTGFLWLFATGGFVYLLSTSPFFDGFYARNLADGQTSFGTGGLLWSSLTLALLTLPVVIVATEEALSAVPNSLREGSYACGAGKWQTIRRIVLPHAMPGIMTGMILAMARGAGEVAPLMLVGAVKLAPELPLDGQVPFLHPSRSFMHLGFHIYDLGFQSQNSEAAKPMVFTTTLLLIAIIAALNLVAIALRFRLKRRFRSSQF